MLKYKAMYFINISHGCKIIQSILSNSPIISPWFKQWANNWAKTKKGKLFSLPLTINND